jgi:hypothetical protein
MFMAVHADGALADYLKLTGRFEKRVYQGFSDAWRQSSKGTNYELQMALGGSYNLDLKNILLARRASNAPAEDVTPNISMSIGLFDDILKSDNGTASSSSLKGAMACADGEGTVERPLTLYADAPGAAALARAMKKANRVAYAVKLSCCLLRSAADTI